MVRCDMCLRWAYFDETDFPCTDAADATPFVCNFCNAVETLEANCAHRRRIWSCFEESSRR